MFLMFPEFKVIRYNKRKALKDFASKQKSLSNIIFKRTKTNEDNEALLDEEGNEITEDISLNDLLSPIFNLDESTITNEDFDNWWNNLTEQEKEDLGYKYKKPKIKKISYSNDMAIEDMSLAQRNNMLIDISYAILSHPRLATNINNPGSFDKIKRISRVTEIAESVDSNGVKLAKIYAEKNDIDPNNTKAIVKHLMNSTLGKLDDFLKEYSVERNPLSIDTFMYNHNQNMTGAALIGMYANGTVSQAKFQESGLKIRAEYSFRINGRTINGTNKVNGENKYYGIDAQRTAPIDGVEELISKNCSEWSAASVDNVKDPVLAKLWQSTDTANIAVAMMRMGLSINEAGILFKHPSIQKRLASGELDASSIDKFLHGDNGFISRYKDKINTRISANHNTNLYLEDLLVDLDENSGDLTKEQAQRIYEILDLFANKILPVSSALGELTRVTRQDSPNGAIDRTLPRALWQRIALENLRDKTQHEDYPIESLGITADPNILENYNNVGAWASKDDLRRAMRSQDGMLNPFFNLGINAPIEILSKYFAPFAPHIQDRAIKALREIGNKGTESMLTAIDSYFSDLTTFILSKSSFFGDDAEKTYEEKRNYYLYEFPKKFIDLKHNADYKDITDLLAIKKMQVYKGVIRMSNGGKLTPSTKAAISQSLDALLYTQGEHRDEALQLAVDLMAYAYYKDGFMFGPNNYASFFSTTFLNAFPEIMDVLRTYDISNEELENFTEQWIANDPTKTSYYIPVYMGKPMARGVKFKGMNNEGLTVPNDIAINDHVPFLDGRPQIYPRFSVDGDLYEFSHTTGGLRTTHHYTRVARLPKVDSKKVDVSTTKYNANMNKEELCSINVDIDALAELEKLHSGKKKYKRKRGKGIRAKGFRKNNINKSDEHSTPTDMKALLNRPNETPMDLETRKALAEGRDIDTTLITKEGRAKMRELAKTGGVDDITSPSVLRNIKNQSSEDGETSPSKLRDIKNSGQTVRDEEGGDSVNAELGVSSENDSNINSRRAEINSPSALRKLARQAKENNNKTYPTKPDGSQAAEQC